MSFSVQEILDWTGGRVVNSSEIGDQLNQVQVVRPSSLGGAKGSDLAFFFSRAFEHELPFAEPGILITGEQFAPSLEAAGLPLWKTSAVVACSNPYLAMGVLSEKFAARLSSVSHLEFTGDEAKAENAGALEQGKPQRELNIHPTAVVAKTASLGNGVKIGPHCVVEAGAEIGQGTVLYPGCYVGPHCIVGKGCVLFPRVTLYEWTQIGNRVRIHAGSVLGSDGFGYAPREQRDQDLGVQKIYHLGRVIIGDDVEIGANSCVDRATLGETRIEKNVKLDNLVHIGHNSQVGEGSIICGGTCLAGNSSTGRFVYVGGLSGIGNQVHLGDGSRVGALTMVTKDVPVGGTAVGNPQREHGEHFRAHALLSRLMAERRKK